LFEARNALRMQDSGWLADKYAPAIMSKASIIEGRGCMCINPGGTRNQLDAAAREVWNAEEARVWL